MQPVGARFERDDDVGDGSQQDPVHESLKQIGVELEFRGEAHPVTAAGRDSKIQDSLNCRNGGSS